MKYKLFFCVLVLFSVVFFIGCSGSSGGGIFQPTPEQLEVIDAVEVFVARINDGDLDEVMNSIDTNLHYRWGEQNEILGHDDFKDKLDDFYSDYTLDSFQISDMGARVFENHATVRGVMTYKVEGGEQITENIEIELEKIPSWIINKLYKYDSTKGETGTSFPPK